MSYTLVKLNIKLIITSPRLVNLAPTETQTIPILQIKTRRMQIPWVMVTLLLDILQPNTMIYGDFPGGPVVKTSPSNDVGSMHDQEAKISHA